MILALEQDHIRKIAKEATRDQAWKDNRGVRGLPVRTAGENYPATVADVTVIDELVDLADALVWSGHELAIHSAHEVPQYVALTRPGYDREQGDEVQIIGSNDYDASRGLPAAMSALACLSGDCGLIGHPYTRPEAETLTAIHNRVRHGGRDVAQAGHLAELCWEVSDPSGSPIWRGHIEDAHAMYLASPLGSHFVPVMAEAGAW